MLGGMGVTVNREKWPRRTKANIGKSGHSSVFIAKKNIRYNSYPFIMVLKSIEVFVSGSIHKEEEVLDNNYGFPNESKWVNRVKKKDVRHYGKCNGQMEIKMMPPEKLLLKFKSSTLSLMQVLEDKNVFKGDGRKYMEFCGPRQAVALCDDTSCTPLKTALFMCFLSEGNPSTREGRTLPKSHTSSNNLYSCWGFGYDYLTDDYKVVKGDTFGNGSKTHFQVFSLKSNAWNVIGEVNYICLNYFCGVLCNGAIHWVMRPRNNISKQVIISFDLSKEDLKEIPQPDVEGCKSCRSLGIMEECLCIRHDGKAWVMKKYNDKQSWEMLPDNLQMKFEFGCRVFEAKHTSFDSRCWFIGNQRFYGGPTIVESLVSPHLQAENE
ncbi:putative F-box domain-containing protein [Tanacetum coccineum]|uniref:F-box domain-containing protein n=1 Tax=Tanacetum coccineum TaxID=301880 RepID=A0ABQ5FJH0_9ASTR